MMLDAGDAQLPKVFKKANNVLSRVKVEGSKTVNYGELIKSGEEGSGGFLLTRSYQHQR